MSYQVSKIGTIWQVNCCLVYFFMYAHETIRNILIFSSESNSKNTFPIISSFANLLISWYLQRPIVYLFRYFGHTFNFQILFYGYLTGCELHLPIQKVFWVFRPIFINGPYWPLCLFLSFLQTNITFFTTSQCEKYPLCILEPTTFRT